ncbi:MAG: shikimate dehydrogenase [Thermoleophilaceae bacterium]
MLAGVLGFPVAHSRSPQMHNAAFEALGLDWRYVRLPVPPELFEETVRALPGSDYGGANVTIPHKRAALALADERSDAAAAIGAANTLTFAGGSIRAENTDAGGLLDALGDSPSGKRALVLGAGGAGRAAAYALRDAGGDVAVWNRTPARARELAADLGVAAAENSDPAGFDLLVNTTSVGLDGRGGLDDLGLAGTAAPETVVDLVYGASETPVCAWAREGGARVVDGVEVLVRQGALSFRIWTGVEPPLDVMRAAARR